ncbi:MAG TPA: DUF423 domain-containing protein [Caulobacteraceae bacterium]|jgi:uncharacterized membrane protein YgdD (TMEM256/DUF423 family)|nr:DUF423 domain-containing protein [Caulobacteraceae bacterium]
MILSNRWLLALAALNGFLGVALGALATHGVSDPHARELIRTGAIYQLIHGVAAVAVLNRSRWSALLMTVGAFLFAVSIYLLAFSILTPLVGPVTPLGGLLIMAGWVVLLVTAFRRGGSLKPENP